LRSSFDPLPRLSLHLDAESQFSAKISKVNPRTKCN
jgi:hypothetical protein